MNRWTEAVGVMLVSLLAWPIYAAAFLVCWAVGLPIVGIGAIAGAWQYEESRVYSGRIVARWRGIWRWANPIWGNEEDGIDARPMNHAPSNPAWSAKFDDNIERIILWSALRNPVNNLCRFLPWFAPWLSWTGPGGIQPLSVEWVGPADVDRHRFGALLCWQGPYAGLKLRIGFGPGIWLGWKVRPEHANPAWWPQDSCWQSIGFSPVRRIDHQ